MRTYINAYTLLHTHTQTHTHTHTQVCSVDVILTILPPAIYGFHNENVTGGAAACALWRFGARWSPDVLIHAQEWRLLVPIFLHSGFLHLAMNVFAQVSLSHSLTLYRSLARSRALSLSFSLSLSRPRALSLSLSHSLTLSLSFSLSLSLSLSLTHTHTLTLSLYMCLCLCLCLCQCVCVCMCACT